jgi:hypothetical protein
MLIDLLPELGDLTLNLAVSHELAPSSERKVLVVAR